jgi:hypothetical protein
MVEDTKVRRITKSIPGVNAQKGAADVEYNTILGGWRPLGIMPLGLIYEDSIDLSGYALQDLTFFPELGFNQMSVGHNLLGSDGGTIVDVTYVSTVPLTDETSLWWWSASGGSPALPQFPNVAIGFQPDATQWETLPFQETRLYSRSSNMPSQLGTTIPIEKAQVGSLDPITVDKLYIYRIVLPYSDTGPHDNFQQVTVPPSRVGFIGTMAEEPTIEYLMRLKRNYELANQV